MSTASVGLTPKALQERRKAIGASDVGAILGVSPYRSAWDVWADKMGMVEPWEGNDATRIGSYLEAGILDYAASKVGPLERNVRIPYVGGPIVSTLDALTAEGVPVEAKTAGMTGPLHGEWGDAMTDHVPDHYLLQVHTQLLCTEAEVAWLFALLSGRGIVQYEIRRHDDLCEALASQLCEWWDRHIVRGIEPSREQASFEIVKRLRRVPNKVVSLPPVAEAWIAERDKIKQELKELHEVQERIDKEILLSLGDAEEGTLSDGRKVTYYEQHRKGYTVEPSSYRVLRVTKEKK